MEEGRRDEFSMNEQARVEKRKLSCTGQCVKAVFSAIKGVFWHFGNSRVCSRPRKKRLCIDGKMRSCVCIRSR